MHTEEEARAKWCPFDRSYLMRDLSVDTGEMRCIASNCMAWRVREIRNAASDDTEEAYGKKVGYCGLAGKPE